MDENNVTDLIWPTELSEGFKQELLSHGKPFPKFHEIGLAPKHTSLVSVGYLVKGIATGYIHGPDEKMVHVGILAKGDWVGAMLVPGGNNFSMYVEQISPVEVISFGRASIESMCESNMETYKWLYACGKEMNARWTQTQLISNYQRSIRIAYCLLEILTKTDVITGAMPVLKVSQQVLSFATGLSRPRLNEGLKELEENGDIEIKRSAIYIVDIAKLKARLDDASLAFRDPRKFLPTSLK